LSLRTSRPLLSGPGPQDREGKELIQRIFAFRNALRNDIRIGYLVRYDMELAKLLTAGTDVWLNTPEPPLEASGTSGMKAALNGLPSLSVLDGWWIEGCIEGVTGWSIGTTGSGVGQPPQPSATCRMSPPSWMGGHGAEP
jgi:starch phosphorylase